MVKFKNQLIFSLVMCIGICMAGCNQNSKSDSESADTTAFTEAIPETINMETEIPTEAKPDYNEIYYEYIQNELIPVYGLASLDVQRDYAAPSNTPHTELLGIVSAEIYDFGNDEKAELLTVTREQNADEPYCFTVYLNLYAYESNEVVNKDRISLDSYSMYSGGEHGDQSELCIYGDVIFQHLDTYRYASSGPYATCNEYTVIDVTDNKFTKEVIQANEIKVMVRDTEEVLYHCEDICINYGGCSDYTDKRDINQANDVLKELFEEKHFSNFEGINLNNNAFITLKINGTPDVKIMDYTSIKRFYTTDHTGLRDHISVQTEPTEQQNYTGRYVGDSWRIDVMDSQITVEMISDGEAVSIVNHSGVISSNMTFEETDRFSKNRYEMTFDGDNIHLTANCIEFYNELADWAIPDTDVTLSKISDTVPDMDISQWSDEKLASAINYYMSRRDYTNGYYVVPNEIQHNDEGIKVYAHNGLGNSKNEYYVNGAKGNDIVCLALNYTGIAEFFHLTDCDSSYKSPYLNSVKIYSCDKKGEINGTDVAGFTTSYVCEGGSVAYVRKVLGDKWHITAKQYCQSKGLTWYELYDTDDGDYYGWVDANYIRFYDDLETEPAVSPTNQMNTYGNENIYVEVEYTSEHEGRILVCYVYNNGSHVSEAEYNGTISDVVSFRANDGWTINDYTIEFLDDAMHLKATSTGETIDEYPVMWCIPDIDTQLNRF